MTKNKISEKERRLFVSGVLSGLAGGVIGNFMVSSYFKFFDNMEKVHVFIVLIFSTILFFAVAIYLFKQTK